MPKNYRRRYRRRRRRQNAASGYLSTASKALSVAYAVKRLVNVEKKKHTIQYSTTPSTSGSLQAASQIAQGDSEIQRDGNSVKATLFSLNYTLTQHASATATFARVMMIRDNQQIADTTPAVIDVLQSPSDINSFLNPSTVGRFTIFYDQIHALSSNGNHTVSKRVNIPMQSHIRFNGSASTDVQKGGLYILQLSSEATNAPTLNGTLRVAYVDN